MHDVAKPLRREAKVKSTRKMVIKALLAVGALVLVICGIKAMQIITMVTTKPPTPVATVTSAPVKEEDWAPTLSAVGTVSAVQGAMVSTELAGTVSEIIFQNGGVAKKGDVIVKLDAAQEEALLRSAEAEAELARTDLERTRGLASQNVVSKAELDAAESKFRRLTAVVDQMRSNIRKKTIVAPFDGELGIRQVNVGQMINAGQQVVLLQSLVIPGSAISYAPYGDSVFVIEKQKDNKTGKESQVLRQQFVRVGEARGDFVSITTGLKAGETVVGTGVFKLRNGMAVAINNDLAPKPQINPTPIDS